MTISLKPGRLSALQKFLCCAQSIRVLNLPKNSHTGVLRASIIFTIKLRTTPQDRGISVLKVLRKINVFFKHAAFKRLSGDTKDSHYLQLPHYVTTLLITVGEEMKMGG
jgi:hypothetical protein